MQFFHQSQEDLQELNFRQLPFPKSWDYVQPAVVAVSAQDEADLRLQAYLEEFKNNFWMCRELNYNLSVSTASKASMSDINISKMSKLVEIKKKQSLVIYNTDFSQNIAQLWEKIRPFFGTGRYFVQSKNKSSICKNKVSSKRRSIYSGVTRNSINYQALVMINNKKTYAGSFLKEIDAAKWFDFYSMLLRNSRATTNFWYTAEEVQMLIDNFVRNDGVYLA